MKKGDLFNKSVVGLKIKYTQEATPGSSTRTSTPFKSEITTEYYQRFLQSPKDHHEKNGQPVASISQNFLLLLFFPVHLIKGRNFCSQFYSYIVLACSFAFFFYFFNRTWFSLTSKWQFVTLSSIVLRITMAIVK